MDGECVQARFGIGELIHHLLFDYRGVVYDVDPVFCGSEEWYRQVARSAPPKDQPWYRVLVNGAEHVTYVAERNLERDTLQTPVSHPAIEYFFERFENGFYIPRRLSH